MALSVMQSASIGEFSNHSHTLTHQAHSLWKQFRGSVYSGQFDMWTGGAGNGSAALLISGQQQMTSTYTSTEDSWVASFQHFFQLVISCCFPRYHHQKTQLYTGCVYDWHIDTDRETVPVPLTAKISTRYKTLQWKLHRVFFCLKQPHIDWVVIFIFYDMKRNSVCKKRASLFVRYQQYDNTACVSHLNMTYQKWLEYMKYWLNLTTTCQVIMENSYTVLWNVQSGEVFTMTCRSWFVNI